jgi:hypothetical protein
MLNLQRCPIRISYVDFLNKYKSYHDDCYNKLIHQKYLKFAISKKSFYIVTKLIVSLFKEIEQKEVSS